MLMVSLPQCRQTDVLQPADAPTTPDPGSPTNAKPDAAEQARLDQLKKDFGQALARALAQEPGLRRLIKAEAVKQFNHEYDVLYHLVKQDPVRADGTTFRQVLLQYLQTPERPAGRAAALLAQMERELPLLTILVPELPEGSFSAETWDPDTQVPMVGLRIWDNEGVPILKGNGEEFFLPFKYTPGFPVVVVKDNERVALASGPGELAFAAPDGGLWFQFTDKNFRNPGPGKPRPVVHNRIAWTLDPKLIQAAAIMDPINGWHRDHIYYDLTPTNPQGPFNANFMETVTSFRFADGEAGYNLIADQPGDPTRINLILAPSNTPPPSNTAAWTDGNFDFIVNVQVSARSNSLAVTGTNFSARGSDLFNITYRLVFLVWGSVYEIESISPVTFHTYPSLTNTPLHLFKWDLENYAPLLSLNILERDASQTTTQTITVTDEYAANFSFNPSGGVWEKIGLQFGASAKRTFSSQKTIVTSLDSDNIGYVTMEFRDKVYLGPAVQVGFQQTREYSGGTFAISVEPTPF
ncbi:MAG: hypothetical protein MUC97_16480 [Bernardetiaceae bacterium]|nr:hypothetical protein [Bernardetiaceae bacterium]